MIRRSAPLKAPDISGIIIIDCWEPDPGIGPTKQIFLQEFYDNLVFRLKHLNPCVVVDATIHYPGSALSHTVNDWMEQYPNERCTSTIEFQQLWKTLRKTYNNKLANWLVVGVEWNICVHNNELGLVNLALLSHTTNEKINFYGTDWGFWRWHPGRQMVEKSCVINQQDYANDLLTWQVCNKRYFKLRSINDSERKALVEAYATKK